MNKKQSECNENKCCHKAESHNEQNVKNDKKCCNEHEKTHANTCCGEHEEHETHVHGDCCGCGHDHEHEAELTGIRVVSYVVGALLLIFAFLGEFDFLNKYVSIACSAVVYVFFAKDVWVGAVKNIKEKKFFTEFTLMCIATLGAIALGEFADAATVIYLYSLGELISDKAYDRSKKNISDLIDITEESVTVISGNKTMTIPATEAEIGDVITVRVGDKIALDGVVVEGNGFADTSSITGESVPRELTVGNECLAGFTLLSGALCVRVTEKYENSTAGKLKAAVERAAAQKAVREKKITRFASVFTPIAFGVAVAVLLILWLFGRDLKDAFRSSLVVLVASCPCSLVLSVPLAYFSGIGCGAKQGIVFRSGQTLDNVAELGTVVFDKTGTLTSATPVFSDVMLNDALPVTKSQLLDMAKSALLKSPHASARAFCEKYTEKVSYPVNNVKNIGGRGLTCDINGKHAALGNKKLMNEINVDVPDVEKSVIYVSLDGVYCGALTFDTELKKNALSHISSLRREGIKRIAVMSGDNEAAVKNIADKISVTEFYSELKPDEKLAKLEYIYNEEKKTNPKHTVGFCGDGLNDSAAIMRADVGIAMGSGSSLTVENADVIVTDDDLSKLGKMMSIAKETVAVVNQNIAISLGVKIAVVLLSIIGYPSLELAVVADVGTAVITVLNAMRVGKSKK